MNPWGRRTDSPSKTAKRGPVVLVAGVVVLACSGLILVLVVAWGNERVTHEVYNYHIFVRIRDPKPGAELWVPVPDFPELRDRTSVNTTFGDDGPFPNTNVTQSIEASPYGAMFRFRFSDSFAVWGWLSVAPGSANGSLTFSSQASSKVWIYLANVTPGNAVSILLHYEVAQLRGFLSNTQVFFVGTADPRGDSGSRLVLHCGVVYGMAYEGKGYTVLSEGWGLYPLVDGGFAESCD